MKKILIFVPVILLVVSGSLHADFRMKGKFVYRDLMYDRNGFTGVTQYLPVRYGKVEIYDIQSGTVLAAGLTDALGMFDISVTDDTTRTVAARIITKNSAGSSAIVAVKYAPYNLSLFSFGSPEYTGHDPAQDIDFSATPASTDDTETNEAFNVFDNVIYANEYIEALKGSPVTAALTVYWHKGSTSGTYFQKSGSTNELFLLGESSDSDGYDDHVIIHEMGHFAAFNYSNDQSPGGSHTLFGHYDVRLTWSEGWANYFSSRVRDKRGDTDASYYVDTSGQEYAGNAFISVDLEGPSYPALAFGSDVEMTVGAILYDIADNENGNDTTPGTDDDSFTYTNGDQYVWNVFNQYFPMISTTSLEDFWDGLLHPSYTFGRYDDLKALFEQFGAQYYPDGFEANETMSSAALIPAGNGRAHGTFYGAGDQDWYKFGAKAGGEYELATKYLFSGANTVITLYNSAGTEMYSNDDAATGESGASLIEWTQAADDTLYVKVVQKTGQGIYAYYGSYDLSLQEEKDGINYIMTAAAGGNISLGISNYGVFGYGDFPVNTDGPGWTYPETGTNILFEGSFMAGISDGQVADAARWSSGVAERDFIPAVNDSIVSAYSDTINGTIYYSTYSDAGMKSPMNLKVGQRTYVFADDPDYEYAIVAFDITNTGSQTVSGFRAGLFFDLDMNPASSAVDYAGWDAANELVYQYAEYNGGQIYGGAALLEGPEAAKYRIFANPYESMRPGNKWEYLSTTQGTDPSDKDDYCFTISAGDYTIAPGQTVRAAFVLSNANSLGHLKFNVQWAKLKWNKILTAVEEVPDGAVPEKFALGQNYPNPFNPETKIRYTVGGESPAMISLKIYDVLGRQVRELVNRRQQPGSYAVTWDGTNDRGRQTASGVYFYRLNAGNHVFFKKMILLK